MKKFFSFLLSAGLLIGMTACDNGGEDEGDGSNGFNCVIKTEVSGSDVTVSVTPSDATVEYQLWVVELDQYTQSVPADAKSLIGSASESYTLASDTEYYAVVYEASMGYKTKEFLTDKEAVTYDCLKGSEYIILSMDAGTLGALGSRVTVNAGADDLTSFVDWWNQAALTVGECVGPNYFGQLSGWISYSVNAGAGGWFGLGFRLLRPTEDQVGTPGEDGAIPEGMISQEVYDKAIATAEKLETLSDEHVLHIAMKASHEGKYNFVMFNAGVEVGTENDPYGFARDGQWHEVEIPLTEFMKSTAWDPTHVNMLAITQGSGTLPATLDVDAIFAYIPAE